MVLGPSDEVDGRVNDAPQGPEGRGRLCDDHQGRGRPDLSEGRYGPRGPPRMRGRDRVQVPSLGSLQRFHRDEREEEVLTRVGGRPGSVEEGTSDDETRCGWGRGYTFGSLRRRIPSST